MPAALRRSIRWRCMTGRMCWHSTLSLRRWKPPEGGGPDQMDFLSWRIPSIYAALQLEAGYAAPGEWRLASDGRLNLSGDLPICTMGGMSATAGRGGGLSDRLSYCSRGMPASIRSQARGRRWSPLAARLSAVAHVLRWSKPPLFKNLTVSVYPLRRKVSSIRLWQLSGGKNIPIS